MKERILQRIAVTETLQKAALLRKQGKGCVLTGLDGTIKPLYLAALNEELTDTGTLVLVVAGRDAVREYRQTLGYLYPELPMQEFYPYGLPRVLADRRNLEIQAGRSAALRLIGGEERGIVFVTAEALLQKQARPAGVAGQSLEFGIGDKVEQAQILAALDRMGYERADEVDTIGQFAVRGEILDVFPLNSVNPVRLEWFDDAIDGMRFF